VTTDSALLLLEACALRGVAPADTVHVHDALAVLAAACGAADAAREAAARLRAADAAQLRFRLALGDQPHAR
jgi:hypothetical protein